MRQLGIWLVLASSWTMALAQTNAPNNAGNAAAPYAPYIPSAPTAATMPAGTNARPLSLQDCIEMTLKHNLNLQIDRINPEISLFALQAGYGAYDPIFTLQGAHDHNETGQELLSGGFTIPGSISDDNRFSSSISGLLPWGTTYSLGTGSPIKDDFGVSGTRVPDLTKPIDYFTNITVNATNGSVTTALVTNYQSKPGLQPFENSSGSVQVSVTQPLLKNFWINSSQLTIRVAKNRLKYSEENLRLQLMQQITTLEQAYYDLIYNRENVVVQQKAVELADRLVMENKKKLEVGTLAPLDLQSAEAQAASGRANLLLALSQLGTQERVVKRLITDHYTAWANVELVPTGTLEATPPLVNLQDSWDKGLSLRPELIQARLDIEKQGIQLKYDKNQLWPELDLFATAGYNSSGKEFSDALFQIQERNQPYYTYGGQITLPLANIGPRNTYHSDKAALDQFVLTLKNLEEGVMSDIDNDIGTIRANFDQVHATRAARQYEESALDAEQKKLDNGKSTTYTVLQVQRDLTNARGAEIQALDNYDKSLSQLSLHEGSTLQRLGINFQIVR